MWIVSSRNLRLKEKPSETLRNHTAYYGQKIYDKGFRLNRKRGVKLRKNHHLYRTMIAL